MSKIPLKRTGAILLSALAVVGVCVFAARGRGGPAPTPREAVAPAAPGSVELAQVVSTATDHRVRRTPQRLPGDHIAAHETARGSLAACRDEHLCAPETICELVDGEVGCYASTCKSASDTSCGPGKVCSRFASGESAVWRCAPAGEAQVGVACMGGRRPPKDQRCSQSLVCWGGKCRQLCDAGGGCSGGHRCVQTTDGAVCVDDTCATDTDCRKDQVCAPESRLEATKICRTLAPFANGVPSCAPGRCPSGQSCDGVFTGSALRARCRPTCSLVPPSPCPDGYVCGRSGFLGYADAPSVCYRKCDMYSQTGRRCDEGEQCRTTTESMSGSEAGCAPIYPRASESDEPEMDAIFTRPVSKPREPSEDG